MIAHLTGQVLEIREKSLVIDVNGVGYLVFASETLLTSAKQSQEISLHIHTRVSENAFDLFGMQSSAERELFEKLITVSGVGPKTALEFLNLPAANLRSAIINGDSTYIGQTKGIGKKTAEKICIELSGKIEMPIGEVVNTNTDTDALEALAGFGYDRKQIERTMSSCPSELTTTEERIKWGLSNL